MHGKGNQEVGTEKEGGSVKDETFVFIQDVKEKGHISRSARNRRTHNGKGGRAKFPSDYMTKKEILKMNGEVKSYKLNDPMSWDEFQAMPDDIKITYIKLLREKFGVPDSHIGKMLGVLQNRISKEIIRLGINGGRGSGKTKWSKDAWLAWCNGAPAPAAEPSEEDIEFDERSMASLEDIFEPVSVPEVKVLPVRQEKAKAIPNSGSMTFEGSIEKVLNTVSALIGGAYVHINIAWDVLPEPCERMAEDGK